MARICLHKQSTRLNKNSRAQRNEILIKDKFGGSVLEWLWKDDRRWVPVFTGEDWEFLNILCYFLAAEKLDDVVIGLLRLPLPTAHSEMPRSHRHRWRGALLRGIVDGHLSADYEGSADSALEIFLRVRDDVLLHRKSRNAECPEQPIASTSFWPAILKLGKSLSSGCYPNTSSEKFDRFLAVLESYMLWNRKGNELAEKIGLTIADLHVNHPTQPNADPLLRLVRDGKLRERLLAIKTALFRNPALNSGFGRIIIRAQNILRDQSRLDDARLLADYTQTVIGEEAIGEFDRPFPTKIKVR